jgi:uncharacterized protein involved in exopolysaccharide biosynthesis
VSEAEPAVPATASQQAVPHPNGGLKLQHVLPFLRRWLWLIVLIGVIPAVVLGGRLRPTYTAIARIQMTAPPDVGVTVYQQGAPYSNLRDDLTVARTDFIQVAYSPQVRNRAVTAVGIANADLSYLPQVQAVRDSNFVDVMVEARTGQLAATMANAHAEAAIAYASELRAMPAKAAVAFLTEQLQAAQTELDAAQSAAATAENPTRAEQSVRSAQEYYKLIQTKLDEARLKSISAYSARSMQVVAPALAPISANDRKVQTQIMLFVLGGLVAGVLIAKLLDVVARKPLSGRTLKPQLGRRLKPVLRRLVPSRARALDALALVIGLSLGMLAGALLVGAAVGRAVAASLGGHS